MTQCTTLKPFDELTEAELNELTPELLELYIDRACAEAGVALLPPSVPVAPTQRAPEPDLEVFQVAGIMCAHLDDARALRDMLAAIQTYKHDYYGRHYHTKAVRETEPPAVTPRKVYSEAWAEQSREALNVYTEATKQYEEEKRAYDETVRERERIAADIRGAVDRAAARASRRRELRRQFERYLQLANGDALIAARFLGEAKGNSDARELLPDLFKSVAVLTRREPVTAAPEDEF